MRLNHPVNAPLGNPLIWSARTSPRFGTARRVAQWESGDKSPHSKLRHCVALMFDDSLSVSAIFHNSIFTFARHKMSWTKWKASNMIKIIKKIAPHFAVEEQC